MQLLSKLLPRFTALLAACLSLAPAALPAQDAVPPIDVAGLPTPHRYIYGQSVQGRPLVGYIFGDGPNRTVIQSCIHGNERNTRPLAERLIAYLKTHPKAYAGCTVLVLPCLNPDGWARGTRVNAHDVDLNRNFPDGWHANVPGKLSRGGAPLSEPESAALAREVTVFGPAKLVSIHNPLHLLDSTGAAGARLARVIAAHDHYPMPEAGVGYPTPGSFGQFCYAHHIAVVTLELRNDGADEAWAQNEAALLAVIQAKGF